jgi:putative mRNA 3-end processing factor
MPLVELTEDGFYCAAGGFHVDPWRPVDRAVITHAHSDHARPGSSRYLAAAPGVGLLQRRLGPAASIEGVAYGAPVTIGGVRVSLHPAGHLLGSAQVRIEHGGAVWVVSGDYKVEPDPTCAPFEPLPCDRFISECTFGLPVYRWPRQRETFAEIDRWWAENASAGRASVIFAYALGKAQRLLAGVDPSIGPILVHGAVARLVDGYRAAGVALPEVRYADPATIRACRDRALVVAPPSAAGTTWTGRFGDAATAFASGWMQLRGTRRRRNVERGFVLSDHADWPGLLASIDATGAREIGLTHGSTDAMARYLGERGLATTVYRTRYAVELEGEDEPAAGESGAAPAT